MGAWRAMSRVSEPFLSGLLGTVVMAASALPLSGQARWQAELRADNDFFVGFSPTKSSDHEYTHGTVLGVRALHGHEKCRGWRPGLELSQTMYTPRSEFGVRSGERRHAGWLRLEITCASGDGPTRSSFGCRGRGSRTRRRSCSLPTVGSRASRVPRAPRLGGRAFHPT